MEFEPHCDSVEPPVTEQETSSHIQRESSFRRDGASCMNGMVIEMEF